MNELIKIYTNHPYLASMVSTWIVNNLVTNAITSMPAPTKDSTPRYVWFFKFANGVLAGNTKRAQASHVENSPNWSDAVNQHLEKMNGAVPTSSGPTSGGPLGG